MSKKLVGNEYNAMLREILDAAKARAEMKLDPLMRELAGVGIVAHGTLRAVYYDQRLGTQTIIDNAVKAVDLFLTGTEQEKAAAAEQAKREFKLERSVSVANRDRRILRLAVAQMCHACASPRNGQEPTCWDASCPLRPVSPLPLGKQVSSALAYAGEEVEV